MVTTSAAVRAQIAQGKPALVYLITGDDHAEMMRLAGEFTLLVDEPLRAFNVDRLYAGDRGVTAASIVEAARTLPAMSDRRVVIVLRGERLLKPKRRAKGGGELAGGEAGAEPPGDVDLLETYVKAPVAETTLAIVASDVDRTRRIYKALQKHGTIVECFGLRDGRDGKPDLRRAAEKAEADVRRAVAETGQKIDRPAVRLLVQRAGTDIVRLRGDIERLLLYAAGRPTITIEDAREIVSAETSQDDWAVTNAIQRRDTAEALRQLALALEAGSVPYMVLGQMAYYVRERMEATNPAGVAPAIEALFRTDLELKSSGDARVLLERLVVQLCR